MRLAVILPSLDGGGIERMRIHLMHEWIQRGIEIDLVVGRFAGPLCDRIPENVQVFEVAGQRTLMFPFGLWRYLKKRQPSHILSAGYDINAITLMVSKCLRNRIPITISAHSHLSSELKLTTGLQRLKIFLVAWVLRRAVDGSHAVIAVSQGVADDLKQHLPLRDGQLHVIYNPVINHNFHLGLSEPLNSCPAPPGKPWVLFVGRLVRQKGIDVLIRAMSHIADQSEAHLVLMGSGPLQSELTRLVQNYELQQRIHWVGFQPNPLPWIREANVLVLPSRFEGLGNTLIEAFACGTQIVATDCPSGPSEILDGGRYGQLVSVDDAEALAQALLRSLDGHFHVDAGILRKRAALFSSEKIASQYEAIMTSPRRQICR